MPLQSVATYSVRRSQHAELHTGDDDVLMPLPPPTLPRRLAIIPLHRCRCDVRCAGFANIVCAPKIKPGSHYLITLPKTHPGCRKSARKVKK